jgi:tetratricopeptide (TPR) repeat protein
MGDDLQNLIDRYKRGNDSRVFAPLADAYRKNGEIDRAIEILEKGLERFPRYASAHVILGKCFYDKGASERAKAEFRHVLELDPENMVALKFMGDILLAEDRRAEAAETYRKIIAIDPTNEEIARALKEMEGPFVGKEIDLAEGKGVRDERPRELATMTLAGIYAAQGYYNKALRIYGEVLQREPDNREAKEMVAKLESIMNSTEAEREAAFEEDVMTISLNDIDEGLVSSTSGHGVVEGPRRDRTPPRESAGDAAAEAPGEARPGEPPLLPPPERQETAAETQSEPPESGGGGDMDQFREWLKRLKR